MPSSESAKEHSRGPFWLQRRWRSLAVVATVVVGVVIALTVRASEGTTANLAAGSIATSAYWQTYHDPLALYSLQLPPGWVAEVDRSNRSTTTEMITFDDPAQGTGSARVSIIATAITMDAQRTLDCTAPMRQNYSGMTLSTLEHTGALALFFTNNAQFQVDAWIPGVLAPATFGAPSALAAPLPASWTATDKTDVNTLLVSFRPSDPKPLAC